MSKGEFQPRLMWASKDGRVHSLKAPLFEYRVLVTPVPEDLPGIGERAGVSGCSPPYSKVAGFRTFAVLDTDYLYALEKIERPLYVTIPAQRIPGGPEVREALEELGVEVGE